MNIGDRIKVKIKSGKGVDLSVNKEYKAEVTAPDSLNHGIMFGFRDDAGDLRLSNQLNSTHLDGGDWEIVK